MLSAAYCYQIVKAPFAQHYNNLTYKKRGIVIIRLMLSISFCPKVITLSGFHCTTTMGLNY